MYILEITWPLCYFGLKLCFFLGQLLAPTPTQGQTSIIQQPSIISIYTATELASIGQKAEFPLDGTYQLENDIDLAGVLLSPIGDEKRPFQGKLYGNQHTITHLSINTSQEHTGLFGVLGKGALLQEVYLKEGQVQGGAKTGLLVGYNQGELRNCCVMGHVWGSNNVGGLVGLNDSSGKIYSTQAFCKVVGKHYEVGGLVGCNLGYVIDSHVHTEVIGVRLVGGLVGTNDETGRLLHCVALGKVTGQHWVGGLVGHNWFRGRIIHCMAAVETIGKEYVGGLAGFNYAEAMIAASTAIGPVLGHSYTGMFVGGNRGTITYKPRLKEDQWRNRLQKPCLLIDLLAG